MREQRGDDLAQQGAGLAPVDAEAAPGPERQPGVLLAARAHRVEAVGPLGGREERRCRRAAGEGGHAAFPAAPDRPPVVPVPLDVAVQPAMPDAAGGSQPVQDAEQPHSGRRPPGGRPMPALGQVRVDLPRPRRRGGQVGDDLGGERAGQLQGPAEPAAQPELQVRLELQPPGEPLSA